MIVTCPNCGTRFQLEPEVLIPNGRRLRCVKCAHSWTERPPTAGRSVATPEPEVVPDFGTERPRPTPRRPAPVARRRPQPSSNTGTLAAWGAFALVFFGLISGLLFAGDTVMRVFPPATTLYELIGLAEAPGSGLEVREVKVAPNADGSAIEISGEVVNVSSTSRKVPPMRATLFNNRRELQSWTFPPPVGALDPGERVAFTRKLDKPRSDGNSLVVTFDPSAGGG